MNGRFLTALHNFRIADDLGRGDRIDDTTFITNNRETIQTVLPKNFVPIMGTMEAKFFIKSPVVVYSNDTFEEDVTPRQFLINKLYLVLAFLNTIWLFRDNSINNELSFLFYGKTKYEKVDSNSIAVRYTTSRGNEEETIISRAELRDIRQFFREKMSVSDFSSDVVTQLTKSSTRINRAFYHVQGARISGDVAIKIANYCSALEALFATSQAELAHQLSERVACFLEDEPQRRFAAYREVKAAYAVRSKIVHGDVIKASKVGELVEISQATDKLVRESLAKIHSHPETLEIFESSPERLDEFMLHRIFGA